jgi:hypothetical protein
LGIVGEKIHTKLRNEITSRKTPWVDCWPYLIIPIIIYINLYGTNFYILSQSRIFPGFDTKGRLPFYYPWIQHLNILIFHYQEKKQFIYAPLDYRIMILMHFILKKLDTNFTEVNYVDGLWCRCIFYS